MSRVERVARFVVAHRRAVLVAHAALALACGTAALRLEVDLSPDALLPAAVRGEGPLPEATRATASFVAADTAPLVYVLAGPSVLTSEALTHLAAASDMLGALPGVRAVDSLTHTPLPVVERGAPAEDVDLDALERGDATLDIPVDATVSGPLADLVRARPDVFPLGFASLGERIGGAGIAVRALGDSGVVDVEAVRAAVSRLPSLRGSLVDAEGTLTVAVAAMPESLTEGEAARAVEAARTWMAANPPPEGLRVTLGGLPAVRVALTEPLRRDRVLLVALATLGSLLVLAFAFRSAAAVALPFTVVGAAIVAALGGMALAGIPVNLITNVIPPLLVSIGLSESVHMVSRHSAELRAGIGAAEAAVRMVKTTWLPCFLTSMTTAVGFAAVVLNPSAAVREFGVVASLAVLFAYAVTMTLLPAALAYRTPPVGAVGGGGEGAHARSVAFFRALGDFAAGHGRMITLGALVLTVVAAVAASRVRIDAALLDVLPPDAPEVALVRELEAKLAGVRTMELTIRREGGFLSAVAMRDVEALAARLGQLPGVLRIEHPVTPLTDAWSFIGVIGGQQPDFPDAHRAPSGNAVDVPRFLAALLPEGTLARHLSADGATARLVLHLKDAGTEAMGRTARSVVAEARAFGHPYRLSGEAYRAAVGLDALVRGLLASFAVGGLVILAMIALSMRDLRLALASLLPNILPMATTGAYMAFRDIPLHASTTMVFDVTIGIVVDGGIHVLAAWKAATGDPRARAAAALAESGRGVVIGALTLLAGFGALVASSFLPVRLFGELSLVALGTALLCQLVLIPAGTGLTRPRL